MRVLKTRQNGVLRTHTLNDASESICNFALSTKENNLRTFVYWSKVFDRINPLFNSRKFLTIFSPFLTKLILSYTRISILGNVPGPFTYYIWFESSTYTPTCRASNHQRMENVQCEMAPCQATSHFHLLSVLAAFSLSANDSFD